MYSVAELPSHLVNCNDLTNNWLVEKDPVRNMQRKWAITSQMWDAHKEEGGWKQVYQ